MQPSAVVPVRVGGAGGAIIWVHLAGDLHRDLYHRPEQEKAPGDYALWRRARPWVHEDLARYTDVASLAADYREIVRATAVKAADRGRQDVVAPLVVDPDLSLRYLAELHYGEKALAGEW